MNDLKSTDFEIEYRTGQGDLVKNFYSLCLRKSTQYDRAVGYFRSSVFTLVGRSVVEFGRLGGRMRLVCSPDLNNEDVKAIQLGYRSRDELLDTALTAEINALARDVSTHGNLIILATLIKLGILEIKIAFPTIGNGVYHEKLGLFYDAEENIVSFKGSSNESWAAWHQYGNVESFDVFCSWHAGNDSKRAKLHSRYFQELWNSELSQVETIPFPNAAAERLNELACKTLEEIPLPKQDKMSYHKTTLLHQRIAIDNWNTSFHRGIFEHATGSGKTFTAILAIKEHNQLGLPTLIIVPSSLLFSQWLEELEKELPDVPIIRVGDGHQVWRRDGRVESFTDSNPDLGPRLILATAQTASKPEFRSRIIGGSHLMLVADEVHRLGSRQNSTLFNIDSGWRLGLSATPYRYGDKEGTERIFAYFGPVVPPKITLKDAIDADRLVPYEYFPHITELTAEELHRWKRLSRDISHLLASQGNAANDMKDIPDDVKYLLIRRSRIAKKARAKVPLALNIIQEHYRDGQSWLIYCEDGEQLREISERLNQAGFSPMHYYTAMDSSHADTLDWFTRYGGLLLSIKCLDEGVDIPSVSHALILASSQNPREFIQRRGRVLRKDPKNPNKTVATIHDALVIPRVQESTTLRLVKSEISRALEFAQNALNSGSEIDLIMIAASLGLRIEEGNDVGMEVDEDE